MRKLILMLILPVVQLIIAWVLLTCRGAYSAYLGDTRALCIAINAPIALFMVPIYRFAPIRWMPSEILGIRSDDFLVLLTVVILWLIVGLAIEYMAWPRTSKRSTPTARQAVFCVSLVAFAIWLFFRIAMDWMARANSQHWFYIADGLIATAWSLLLVAFSAWMLLRAYRPLTAPC